MCGLFSKRLKTICVLCKSKLYLKGNILKLKDFYTQIFLLQIIHFGFSNWTS
jgi:hypothetical protein